MNTNNIEQIEILLESINDEDLLNSAASSIDYSPFG
jgi:hypothetical protein